MEIRIRRSLNKDNNNGSIDNNENDYDVMLIIISNIDDS